MKFIPSRRDHFYHHDLLYDTTNVPNSASDVEENDDTEVKVQHKYIIRVNNHTIGDKVVDSSSVEEDSNTVEA